MAAPAAVGISILGSLLKGLLGSSSAEEAAEILKGAGFGAAEISMITGHRVAEDIETTAEQTADVVRGTSEGTAGDLTATATTAAEGVLAGADQANLRLDEFLQRSGDLTQPYRTAGEEAIGTLADIGQSPEEFEFEKDKGFQFRLSEGEKAIQRAAAASGALQSGGAGKALLRYGQGFASHEYDKAFGRFDTNRKFRANTLASVAGFGERAVGQQIGADRFASGNIANNLIQAPTVAGDFRMRGQQGASTILNRGAESYANVLNAGARGAGNVRLGSTDAYTRHLLGAYGAEASGRIGSANAWGNTISELASIPGEYPNLFGGGGSGGGGGGGGISGPGSYYDWVLGKP
jgi:hypothetical protein